MFILEQVQKLFNMNQFLGPKLVSSFWQVHHKTLMEYWFLNVASTMFCFLFELYYIISSFSHSPLWIFPPPNITHYCYYNQIKYKLILQGLYQNVIWIWNLTTFCVAFQISPAQPLMWWAAWLAGVGCETFGKDN